MAMMARCALRLALGLVALPGLAPDGHAMSAYQWKKRPLVVFAASEGDAALARQRAIVSAGRGGMAERHMVIVWVVGEGVSVALGVGPGLSAGAMRSRYGVGKGSFRAFLVGKDGGVKITSSSPLSTGTLFGTIDAMPMRRDELRGRR